MVSKKMIKKGIKIGEERLQFTNRWGKPEPVIYLGLSPKIHHRVVFIDLYCVQQS